MRNAAMALLFLLGAVPNAHAEPEVDAARIEGRIQALSAFGRNADGGVDRVAFSEHDRAARDYVSGLMRAAGLEVRLDAAANLIGRRAGTEPKLPPILFGSHIDSVPGGGNYDGDVGVIGALEVIEVLNARGTRTRHPLEVVVFTDEEGGTVGSRAVGGEVEAATLASPSHSGRTIAEGIRFLGGDPERLAEAWRAKGSLAAYLELHIEQGARLEEAQADIGVVEGIVGIGWWDITIEGQANHAGTTPMNRRHDALAGAAELTLAIEHIAATRPGRQVATVGRIRAEPGAPNVIPGRVVMSLEIRDLSRAVIDEVLASVRSAAEEIGKNRGLAIRIDSAHVDLEPALTDRRLQKVIVDAADALGLKRMPMPSGAGHDAQELAPVAPIGMIFVPSRGGISHSPREYTSPQQMANGAAVLLRAVLAVDGGVLER
jgi:N-carbamoyl-L-amino-acid hydrolase